MSIFKVNETNDLEKKNLIRKVPDLPVYTDPESPDYSTFSLSQSFFFFLIPLKAYFFSLNVCDHMEVKGYSSHLSWSLPAWERTILPSLKWWLQNFFLIKRDISASQFREGKQED